MQKKFGTPKKFLMIAAATAALGLGLTACAGGGSATPKELTLEGGWAKASDSMTGVFGTLTNPGKEEVALVDASTSVAGITELHETVVTGGNMVMQKIDGGFKIPAGGTFELEPGGDHIMLMDLNRELLPGEELDLQLTFSDGSVQDLQIDIRDFAGAIEEYAPGDHDEHTQTESEEHDSHD